MQVTFYHKPSGRKEVLNVFNVYPEDEAFFKKNNIAVSMEEIGDNQYALYADCGFVTEDGDEDEVMSIAINISCEEALRNLRQECERELAESKDWGELP